MANLMLIYKLQPGVTRDQFERWVLDTDYPAMRGLRRVAAYVNHRAERRLVGEGEPSVDYVELFDIPDLDGFVAEDMPGQVVQAITADFMGFAAAPEFIVLKAVA